MLTETFLTYGQPEPPAELMPLRAGPLAMLYDPTNGFVRRIALGKHEALRGIYAAVRDHNWDTIPGALREITRAITPQSFRVEFESVHRRADLDFVWRGQLLGKADGTLSYLFEGEARKTFRRNRIGFCVLHPIRECAGVAARQIRADGSVVHCCFPDIIERQIFGQNSFHDLQGMAHELAPGCWLEVAFEGDLFEMEDQRNWTDASFKTYCTPLALPFPVEILAGTRIRQQVTLRLQGTPPEPPGQPLDVTATSPAPITITVPAKGVSPKPRLGLAVASHDAPLSESEIARLRSLRLSHLRLDLRLASHSWAEQWQRAEQEARQLGVDLELALHLPRSDDLNLTELQRRLQTGSINFARVLALRDGEAATSPDTLARVRRIVGDLPVPVGAGSDANFCELNREHVLGRFALAEADFVFWSINPQVHAFDHLSLVETLEAQPDTVKTARAFAAAKPMVISPVTLRQRFNPAATGPAPPVPPGELPPQVDPRQISLFGAAWTLGSLAALSFAGVAAATFYETTGWRGVMETEVGSPLPQKFPSRPGAAFPVFHAFAGFADFDWVAPVIGDSRLTALALFNTAGGRRLLLANLTGIPLEIQVAGCGATARASLLDATRAKVGGLPSEGFLEWEQNLISTPSGVANILLPAYALARVDCS
jgi:hypothetical protein